MNCKTTEWIYWLLATVAFLMLVHSRHGSDLGLSVAGFAVVWYVIVPEILSGRK